MIANANGRYSTAAAYALEIAGMKRTMCLVFAKEGLISVYIPQSELTDVWPTLIDSLRKDSRYRRFHAEKAAGEFDSKRMRVLVHEAWLDERRRIAIVAFVVGLKEKELFASSDGSSSPEVPPFLMYTSLARRSVLFRRFRDDVRPALLKRAGSGRHEKEAADKAKATREADEKPRGTILSG